MTIHYLHAGQHKDLYSDIMLLLYSIFNVGLPTCGIQLRNDYTDYTWWNMMISGLDKHDQFDRSYLSDTRRYMMIRDDTRRYMTMHDDTWRYVMVRDDTWYYMMILDDMCWYVTIYDDTWWYVELCDNKWRYMTIHDYTTIKTGEFTINVPYCHDTDMLPYLLIYQ